MKLLPVVSIFALGLGGLCAAATQGCGSDSGSSSGGTTGGGKTVVASPTGAAPATLGDETTFAVNALYLGESDRNGTVSATAWQNFGFDLDGKISTKDSTDVCKRVSGAAASAQEDGPQGIDNAFGKSIIQLIQAVAPGPSKTINEAIQKGTFTLMLKVKGLTDDPKQSNTGLSGTLLVGGEYSDAGAPTFDTNTDWPYRQDPQVAINGAYINNGTFVNGSTGTQVKLSLSIGGASLDLTVNKAFITFDHTAPNDISNGIIAGVIGTQELLDGISKVAGRISPSLCGGATVDNIKDTLKKASDINSDGTNDPSRDCDAISVAIGFTGKKVKNPTKIAAPGDVPPDPCLDAGK